MSRKLVALGLSCLAVALAVLIAYGRRPSFPSTFKNEPIATEAPAQSGMEAELLVLRPDGFQPREIKRRHGKFLLAIQNQSSEEGPSFILTREAGHSLKQMRVPKRQSKYRELIDLPPGTYVLTEANHPDWTCQIIIEQ